MRNLQTITDTKVLANGDYLIHFDWNAASDRIRYDAVCAIYEADASGMSSQSLITGDCYADAPLRNPLVDALRGML